MRIGLAIALVAAIASLAGCQESVEIGALNRCGEPVEVDVVSKKELADDNPAWSMLDAGERAGVRSVSDRADSIYLMIRRPGADRIVGRTVPVSDLTDAPDDVDHDKDVVLSGGLCP